ncbi:ABC transporter ATP-binding protein [Rhodocytophaga rosea]|uniref:ABC transporter ATP-binding protein n=1 Tax=Rhodocytophaga rosea TaxID=2704465 RepID=A0A6C0GNF6_9BACT|nr:ABC transporter ATP-binding protein [Rhodocytophaga rosea]QHT69578.1 ABC transporter ATP-binding protein [Rhodocytophaga rosea]
MTVVVRVENVSKKYQLGKIGAQSFQGEFQRWWSKVRGKEDPFKKIGVQSQIENSEFWALRDINFEVQQGDAVGIIGKNGAGKSTLLKILSRITLPTTGSVKVKGRIASLLEVGTGFNPELTGRENIFLNGAILGMNKAEVKAKFDEIVDFSGIEKFIDTPVKRYSSGMYVRLAFAVAAHLESEILILDEVLAVGDAEFQKKCLGKMDDVAHKQGRTILFVSHNLTAVKSLCNQAVMLSAGNVIAKGSVEKVAALYLQKSIVLDVLKRWDNPESAPGNELVRIKSARVISQNNSEFINIHTALDIEFEFWNYLDKAFLNFSIVIFTSEEVPVLNTVSPKQWYAQGVVKGSFHIPADFLNDRVYRIQLLIVKEGKIIFNDSNILTFEVVEGQRNSSWHGKWVGVVRPKFEWKLDYVPEKIKVG